MCRFCAMISDKPVLSGSSPFAAAWLTLSLAMMRAPRLADFLTQPAQSWNSVRPAMCLSVEAVRELRHSHVSADWPRSLLRQSFACSQRAKFDEASEHESASAIPTGSGTPALSENRSFGLISSPGSQQRCRSWLANTMQEQVPNSGATVRIMRSCLSADGYGLGWYPATCASQPELWPARLQCECLEHSDFFDLGHGLSCRQRTPVL